MFLPWNDEKKKKNPRKTRQSKLFTLETRHKYQNEKNLCLPFADLAAFSMKLVLLL